MSTTVSLLAPMGFGWRACEAAAPTLRAYPRALLADADGPRGCSVGQVRADLAAGPGARPPDADFACFLAGAGGGESSSVPRRSMTRVMAVRTLTGRAAEVTDSATTSVRL